MNANLEALGLYMNQGELSSFAFFMIQAGVLLLIAASVALIVGVYGYIIKGIIDIVKEINENDVPEEVRLVQAGKLPKTNKKVKVRRGA